MKLTLFFFSIFFLSLITLTACSPKIYLVDRQTALEEEAAGEWPEFENDLLNQSKATGPTLFPKTANSEKTDRLYNVLNGEVAKRAQE